MKQLKKILKKHKESIFIGLVSIVAFIIGGLAINFLVSFLIVGAINILLFGPKILSFMKKKGKRSSSSTSLKKDGVPARTGKGKKSKTKKKKWFKIILIILCIFTGIGIILSGIFVYVVVKNAPEFNPDNLYMKESTIVLDNKGDVIAKLGTEKREVVSYDELPEVLVDAIVATEDSRFFQHNGFDLPRFIRASLGQALGNSEAGGASTLTMQLVKQNFTSSKASGWDGIVRKFTDIYMAIFKIEKKYTKEEIIEFYVNSNYLGGGAHGVEQASLNYFGKSVKDINLAEAALLAGLFQSPVWLDPYNYPDAAENRRNVVLYLMERHGYITGEERGAAKELSVDKIVQEKKTSSNPYLSFLDVLASEIQKKYGFDIYSTSVEVHTTLDREKQEAINKAFSGETYKWENDVVDAGLAVVDVQTGALVAVGGGRHATGAKSLNNAADPSVKYQIGSTAKPLFDYAPGIEFNNWSTYTPFTDEEHSYSGSNTTVNNWDMKFKGFYTLRDALIESRNIPALKAFQQIDKSKVKSFVTNLGLSPESEFHEAHAIGGYNGENPLSLAAAYASFANGGYYTKPYTFTKIISRETGEVTEYKPTKTKVMSEETAYMVMDMLVDTAKSALSPYHSINGYAYGAKTGTSNLTKETIAANGYPSNAVNDLWVAGTSPEYAMSIWYGYHKKEPKFYNKLGGKNHFQLYQLIGRTVFGANKSFTKPNGVVEVTVEKETSPAMLPSEFTPDSMKTVELFKKGTEPTEVSKRYSALTNVTGLNGTLNLNKLTLTWTGIDTPDAIRSEALSAFYQKLYKKASDQQYYLNQRVAYNNANIGEVSYNVYEKQGDGSLKLLGNTKDTSFVVNVSSLTKTTYVVKSVYTIFKANTSSGSEFTVSYDDVVSLITSELSRGQNVTLTVGDTYHNTNEVKVLENLIDVTSSANITKTIVNQSNNQSVSSIDTNAVGTYIITYKIKYKDYDETLIQTVKIQN